jgi:hypothetical protein
VADLVAASPRPDSNGTFGGDRLPRLLDRPDRQTTWDPRASADLQEELRATLAEAASQNQSWAGTDVAAWMSQRLARAVSYGLGWSYLVKLKHSQQRPRPRHALADLEEQESFKESSDRS